MAEIHASDVAELLLGAQLLSGGGGVSHTVTARWLEHVLAETGPVLLIDAADLQESDLCVPVALVGSPTVLEEKPPAGDELVRAVRGMERRLGTPVAALAALAAASLNALAPVTAAAQLGLPLVDAEGMGRMFPLMEMTVWTAEGLPAAPVVLAGSQGDVVTLEPGDNTHVEQFARPAIVALGGWAAAALYPMAAATLVRHGIHGSLRRALRLGRILAEAQRQAQPRGRDLAREVGGRLLFTGEVIEVSRPADSGCVVVARNAEGHMLRLEIQDECLVALVDGAVVAAAPDLICPVERVRGEPVGVEQVHCGQVLDVLGFGADPAWRTPAGLALAGPVAFGYPIPYGDRP